MEVLIAVAVARRCSWKEGIGVHSRGGFHGYTRASLVGALVVSMLVLVLLVLLVLRVRVLLVLVLLGLRGRRGIGEPNRALYRGFSDKLRVVHKGPVQKGEEEAERGERKKKNTLASPSFSLSQASLSLSLCTDCKGGRER